MVSVMFLVLALSPGGWQPASAGSPRFQEIPAPCSLTRCSMQPSRPWLTNVNRGLMDVYRDQPALTGCRLKLLLIRPPPPRPAYSLISEDAQCSAAMGAVGQLRQAGKHKCLKKKGLVHCALSAPAALRRGYRSVSCVRSSGTRTRKPVHDRPAGRILDGMARSDSGRSRLVAVHLRGTR